MLFTRVTVTSASERIITQTALMYTSAMKIIICSPLRSYSVSAGSNFTIAFRLLTHHYLFYGNLSQCNFSQASFLCIMSAKHLNCTNYYNYIFEIIPTQQLGHTCLFSYGHRCKSLKGGPAISQ